MVHSLAILKIVRTIFFTRTPQSDESYFYEDKLKDSRRQLIPVARLLDLPENRTWDKVAGEAMLDYRDVRNQQEDADVGVSGERIYDDDNNNGDDSDSTRFSDSDATRSE